MRLSIEARTRLGDKLFLEIANVLGIQEGTETESQGYKAPDEEVERTEQKKSIRMNQALLEGERSHSRRKVVRIRQQEYTNNSTERLDTHRTFGFVIKF